MATVLLIRHGRTAANASGVLAGRSPGVEIDEVGRAQATATAERLAPIPLVGVVSSPLLRCRQTARLIIERQSGAPAAPIDRGLIECDYGEWQGRSISELSRESLWATVQTQPSAAVFPGGEAMTAMQARALAALHRHDRDFEAEFGPDAVWAAVTHADLIKAVLADAQGLPLDSFQRIAVSPASVSVVSYRGDEARLRATSTQSGDIAALLATDAPPPRPSEGDGS